MFIEYKNNMVPILYGQSIKYELSIILAQWMA